MVAGCNPASRGELARAQRPFAVYEIEAIEVDISEIEVRADLMVEQRTLMASSRATARLRLRTVSVRGQPPPRLRPCFRGAQAYPLGLMVG